MYYKLVEQRCYFNENNKIEEHEIKFFVEADSEHEAIERVCTQIQKDFELNHIAYDVQIGSGREMTYKSCSSKMLILSNIIEVSKTDISLHIGKIDSCMTYSVCIKVLIHNFKLNNDFETKANILISSPSFEEAYKKIIKEIKKPRELLLLTDPMTCRTVKGEVKMEAIKILSLKEIGNVYMVPKTRGKLPRRLTTLVMNITDNELPF